MTDFAAGLIAGMMIGAGTVGLFFASYRSRMLELLHGRGKR